MSDNEERRRAERYSHKAHATLIAEGNPHSAHLINISRCGALVAIIDEHDIRPDDEITLHVEMGGQLLTMTGTVAHSKQHYLGLECEPPGGEDQARIEALIEEINTLSTSA